MSITSAWRARLKVQLCLVLTHPRMKLFLKHVANAVFRDWVAREKKREAIIN